ncbi:NisI/SpaI family lantibiotic immunity lipoprotein [Clostridium intestinale]|uniref:NisI/SpaI family lantibiotic immunity lipoprotein n=1 Tax=Clostridium intestinale TaxID=36845 RepID=UPI002DD64905|nr:NisI/SpaI family lantibiotic immunity lipoprotein [Clostridium intestinale]WRY52201.1 NisI/SpaI family lantibiotic immunity lipoprotein [Clostridium intestinale]
MKRFFSIFLLLIISLSISECSFLENQMFFRRSNREYCIINEKDARIFSYKSKDYIILEDLISKDMLGNWVGYIQKVALLNDQYSLLELRELKSTNNFIDNSPDETAYVIQYFNIYESNSDNQELIVKVNDGFHKAIPLTEVNKYHSIKSFKNFFYGCLSMQT